MTLGCFYEVLIRVPARSSSRIQVRYKHYMHDVEFMHQRKLPSRLLTRPDHSLTTDEDRNPRLPGVKCSTR